MKFEDELKKGNFLIGNCFKCNKVVWPPSDHCNYCFGDTKWKTASRIGRLLEYSTKDAESFCLAEFDYGVKIMGALTGKSKKPEVGSKVKLEKCGIKNNNYSFVMSLI